MDQKKTLWIIAAVGVFLLVVVGAAMIIYSPSQTGESSMASLQSPNNTWTKPVETKPVVPENTVVGSGETAGTGTVPESLPGINTDVQNQGSVLPTTAVDSVNVITGTTNVYDLGTTTTTIDLNALKESAAVKPVNQAGVAATTKPVTTEKKDAAAVKTPPAKESVKETAPAKAVVAETEKTAVAPKAPADQYWVQVASVTSKVNAENAKQILLDNKIQCEIFTHQDDSGVLYYRLRVGPYTTKTEAEYWQGLISSINEFSGNQSYITNSSAKKVN